MRTLSKVRLTTQGGNSPSTRALSTASSAPTRIGHTVSAHTQAAVSITKLHDPRARRRGGLASWGVAGMSSAWRAAGALERPGASWAAQRWAPIPKPRRELCAALGFTSVRPLQLQWLSPLLVWLGVIILRAEGDGTASQQLFAWVVIWRRRPAAVVVRICAAFIQHSSTPLIWLHGCVYYGMRPARDQLTNDRPRPAEAGGNATLPTHSRATHLSSAALLMSHEPMPVSSAHRAAHQPTTAAMPRQLQFDTDFLTALFPPNHRFGSSAWIRSPRQ